jgi:hypothetical protein
MSSRPAARLLLILIAVSTLAGPGCAGPRLAAAPTDAQPPQSGQDQAAASADPHAAHRHAAPDQDDLDAAEMGPRRPPPAPVDPALRRRFVEEYEAKGANERQVFEKYIESMGPAAILDYLEEAYPLCHGEAHEFGVALFAKTQDLAGALQVCGHRCTSGCMHGAIREAFHDQTFEQVTGNLEGFCRTKAMSDYPPGNCAHALGHAIMVAAGRELPKALDGCSKYATEAMQYYCATGVFMEYNMDPPKIDISTVTPNYPCDIPLPNPPACYRYEGKRMLKAAEGHADRFAQRCLALSGGQRLGCFLALGSAHIAAIAKTPALLADVCRFGEADDQTMCVDGAIEKLADFDAGKADLACTTLPEARIAVCREAARGGLYRLDRGDWSLYTRP